MVQEGKLIKRQIMPFFRCTAVSYPPEMPHEYMHKGFIESLIQGTNLYKLYLYYCYQLGILPDKTTYRPTSPILKEDIRKMDEISDQAKYMGRNKISTMVELLNDREKTIGEIKELSAERVKIYNKLRRAKPEDIPALKERRDDLSKRIETLRKDLKLNHKIEQRSAVIKDKRSTNNREAKTAGIIPAVLFLRAFL